MTLKMKLTSTICAFLLILGLTIMGVMASPSAKINLGGSLTFTATDVNARVTGKVTEYGNEEEPQLPELLFSAGLNETEEQELKDKVDQWGDCDLEFKSTGKDLSIVVTIENLADRPLYASINVNENMTAEVSSTMEELNSAEATSGEVYNGEVLTIPAKQGETTYFAYVKLTMEVEEKNASLPEDAKWGYDIELMDSNGINTNNISNLSFTVLDEAAKTASVSMKSLSETFGDVVIPSYVTIDSVTGEAVMATAQTNSENLYKVTNISEYAFFDFDKAMELMEGGMPEEEVFAACSARIKSITLPDTLERIEGFGLFGIVSLESVTMNCESIGSYAFSGCSGLARVTIGENCKSIGDEAFNGCSGLETITVAKGDVYEDRGLNAIVSTNKIVLGCKNTTIDSSIKAIGIYAFRGCTGLTSIDLSNVTSIENNAFMGCSGLARVTIGENCDIGSHVFLNCTALTTVTINSQNVVNGLINGWGEGDLIDRAGVTINIRADLTPTSYLTGLGTPTTVTIDGVEYKQYYKA